MTALLRHRPWLAILALAWAPGANALTLTEALRLALAHDPAVPVSTATYEAERELGDQERAARLPQLSADANLSETDREVESEFFGGFEERYASNGVGVELRQPLFRLDWFARGDRADARDTVAQLAYFERALMLLQRVAERYFGVLVAQDQLALAEAEAGAVRESLDDTQKRYDVELVPGMDLKEAKARDDLAQARLLAARRNLESAQDTLAETTGRRDVSLPRLPPNLTLPPLQPADAQGWVHIARRRNPGIRIARQQAIIARADVSSRRAEAAPSLDAVGRYRRDDTSESQIGQLSEQGVAALELVVPLYAGGLNHSRVAEAKARQRAAEAKVRQLLSETERAARDRFRQVQTAQAQAEAFEQALLSAEAAALATRHGYDAGTRTITDVLDAKSRVVSARRDLNQARYELLTGIIELKQVAGTLDESDFEAIDRVLTAAPQP